MHYDVYTLLEGGPGVIQGSRYQLGHRLLQNALIPSLSKDEYPNVLKQPYIYIKRAFFQSACWYPSRRTSQREEGTFTEAFEQIGKMHITPSSLYWSAKNATHVDVTNNL